MSNEKPVDLTSKATKLIVERKEKRRKKVRKEKVKAQLPHLSSLGIDRLGKRTAVSVYLQSCDHCHYRSLSIIQVLIYTVF